MATAAADVHAQSVSNIDSLGILPSSIVFGNNTVDTNFKVSVMVDNAANLGAISIPLKYAGHPGLKIDTLIKSPEGNKGVTYGPAGRTSAWTIKTSLVDEANKGILLGFVSFSLFPPTKDTLCYVHFDLLGGGISGTVPLDSGVVNNQRLRFTDIDAVDFIPTWSRGLIQIGTPQPAIGLSPTSLTFSRVIGTGNPPAQNVSLTNTAAGTLNWSATATQSWLGVTPASGTGNATLSVSVNTTGLTPGTRTGYVVVTDPAASNSPESVLVTLTLTSPTLTAAPSSLTFTAQAGAGNPAPQSITLSATQSAAVNWTGTKVSSWLSFAPPSGTTPNTIAVNAAVGALTPGTYRDTIVFTAPLAANSPLRVPVTFLVTQPPLIALSPAALGFVAVQGGANPPPDTITVTNAGGGTLNFTAATDQPWLSVLPASGTAPQDVQVSASIAGRAPGIYTGHVIVSSATAANSPETALVTLEVQANPAVLDVSPLSGSFAATEGDPAGTPAQVTVVIRNTGGGTLNWSVSGLDSGWVTLSKLSGIAPDTVRVSVVPPGLKAGTYQETFQFTAAGAVGSPQTFTVNLDVAAGPPTIALSPTALEFSAVAGGTSPAARQLNISNVGGSLPLEWTASHTRTWLSLSATAGTAPSTIDVAVDIAGLTPGTYEDTIVVSAAGATNTPQVATVRLSIQEPPAHIAVVPDSLVFVATIGDPNPSARSLTISNTGGGTLDWTAAGDRPWLSVTPMSGTAPSTVQVAVDLAGLAPGTYDGSVQILSARADNSPFQVPVRLVVNDLPPALSVDPTSLAFSAQEEGPNPPAQSFFIVNAGGGLMPWSVTTEAPWIVSLDPVSGTNDYSVMVRVDITGLTAGTYEDSILVDAGAVAGSPQYVRVTLQLAPPPPPLIVLEPAQFSFMALFGAGNPLPKSLQISNGGGRRLEWSASNTSPWLTLNPVSGTAPSAVGLSVDITGLAVGTYYDTIVVVSDSAVNSPQVAQVRLNVVENPPQIVLTPTSFTFEIVVGGTDPLPKSLQIGNAGAGVLSWTAVRKAPWLSLAPSAGEAPSTVSVSVSGSGLIPGTYRDTIRVESPEAINSPREAIVTFVVKSVAKPAIVLQPDSLYFILASGEVSDPQCTYVFIDGNGGRMVWRARTDADWISLSRDSCNISYPLCLTVDATGLAPGVYCDSVELSGDASNSPQYLTVCMDVRGGGDQPILVVQKESYSFTATEGDTVPTAAQTFTVSNAGSGVLTWTATSLASWVQIAPASGTAPSTGTLRANPIGLLAGVYRSTVEFDAPGALNSPGFVSVTLTVESGVEPAVLVVSPTSIQRSAAVGSNPIAVGLAITNGGGGTLTYYIGAGLASWLSVSKTSGTAPDDVEVTLAPSGLAAGTYYDTLIIGSPEAGNSPVAVPVAFTLADGLVDVDSVRVGTAAATPGQQVSVPVYFDNSVPLFGVSVPLTWRGPEIKADSVSFTGSRVEGLEIVVASVDNAERVVRIGVIPIDETPIPIGSGLLAHVFFTVGPSSPNQISVIDTITPSSPPISLAFIDTATQEFVPGFRGGQIEVTGALPPVLAVTPDSVGFAASAGGTNPPPVALVVGNSGGSLLTFTATEAIPWLSVNPATGSQGDTVFFTVDIAGLSPDIYSGSVAFSSPEAGNSPVVVPVTLVLGPPTEPPFISLEPDQLSFTMSMGGSPPPPDTIVVTNTGGGTLAWTASHSEPWLSVTPLSGGSGQQVVVRVIDSLLPAGEYFDTIEFSDPSASNSPRTALVELTVKAPAGPDTVFVADVTADPGDTVIVPVRIRNSFSVTGITLPFKFSGTGVSLVTGDRAARTDISTFPIFANTQIDNVAHTGLFGFISFGAGMAPGYGDVLLLKFAIAPDAPSQVITIDTTTLPPANVLVLNDEFANEIFPEFVAGRITVGSGAPNSIWLSEVTGTPGERVTLEVEAENGLAVGRLRLPLFLSSADASIVAVEFGGTRAESGLPEFSLQDPQHFLIDIIWPGDGLAAGAGSVARVVLELSPTAVPQTVFVDTSGDFGFTVAGAPQAVIVPAFSRGVVHVRVASSTEDPVTPESFALGQNYPNPFNPSTTIAYTVARAGFTRLDIYNMLGGHIVTLVEEYQGPGTYRVDWNGRDAHDRPVASGVYLYRLDAGRDTAFRKMTLMK